MMASSTPCCKSAPPLRPGPPDARALPENGRVRAASVCAVGQGLCRALRAAARAALLPVLLLAGVSAGTAGLVWAGEAASADGPPVPAPVAAPGVLPVPVPVMPDIAAAPALPQESGLLVQPPHSVLLHPALLDAALDAARLAGPPAPEAAAPDGGGRTELSLRRADGRLLLSGQLHWSLPHAVQEALYKGIPVQFITEVQLLRPRWYWADRTIVTYTRHQRLSYQPLTRQWRIHTGSAGPPSHGLTLGGPSYSRLPDALAAMQRVAAWDIGSADALADAAGDDAAAPLLLRLRLRIDPSRFPRPLQIGTLGRPDWDLLLLHTQSLLLTDLLPAS